ncbi:hypothetical protein PMAYCL1PPCAC_25946 [Pristionchus mayeri]|uniref:Activin types I and II receptor domain-containing protein n=1 Tax=Pristionchus mayeri TaxID=1317129 RepID=A0AAN5D3L1_9BILA|nr:hypothetical protein PMAYCL1PPCAC_25946 [Pristionchus mayeri]
MHDIISVMKTLSYILLLLISIHPHARALQCLSGSTYVKGQSIGTDKLTCQSGEYCYNVTGDLSDFSRLTHAGCSATRCFIAHNKCIEQNFLGKMVKFCCCNNGDFCNSRSTNSSIFTRAKNRVKDFLSGFGK